MVILFGGWVLLRALNPDLLKFQTIQPPSVKLATTTPPTVTTTTATGATLSEQDARNLLTSNGISVNAQPPQTTLVGIQQSTLSTIVSLKNSCGGCQVQITGGTESGHAAGTCSHSSGNKVDLA